MVMPIGKLLRSHSLTITICHQAASAGLEPPAFRAAQMKLHRGVQSASASASASAMFRFISRPQWLQHNLVPAQFQARVARI